MINKMAAIASFLISTALGVALSTPDYAYAQSYTIPPELQVKIDAHPNVRQIAEWGSRADWAPDSKRLLFVSKQFGDVFELDVATGKTRPLTFNFSHAGIIRAFYLANGDILLAAPRVHTPGKDNFERIFKSELWVLKGDLSAPPVALGVPNLEGVAVSQNKMRIAWGTPPGGALPSEATMKAMANTANEIWTADIVGSGDTAKVANSRLLVDCAAKVGPLAAITAKAGTRCWMVEPQNFVPLDDTLLTFSLMTVPANQQGPVDLNVVDINPYTVNLRTGEITALKKDARAYAEIEGVFPDGKSSIVEYYDRRDGRKAVDVIDLWRMSLDGRETLTQLTRYNSIDPQLKANQGVVSPDGRWMAFGISTAAIEDKVPGQGIGLFLMDLKAAGF